jgi:hypothetical protein
MAAPVFAQWYSYTVRDAKGQTSRMRVLIGGASSTAVESESQTLKPLLAACSNGHWSLPNQDGPDHVYGGTGDFQDAEDKAMLVFTDPSGRLHRFQLPCPRHDQFQADTETINASATAMAALLANMQANVYGAASDTAPLVYIAGTRLRKKLKRKLTIWTKDPTLAIPAE